MRETERSMKRGRREGKEGEYRRIERRWKGKREERGDGEKKELVHESEDTASAGITFYSHYRHVCVMVSLA